MTLIPVATVLRTARFAGLLTVLAVLPVSSADAQSRPRSFSGLYAGVDAGSQQIIGGSLVDGVDTLQEDSRVVVTFYAGLRAQLSGFVIGGELGYGRTDGDLVLTDPARLLTVDYNNNSQWNWTLNGGHTIGGRTLLFGYLSEVTRQFDVSVVLGGRVIAQQDEQGLLRFGAGIEQQLTGPLRLRATAGSSRADFGDRATNIEPGRRLEAAVGVVIQF